MTTSDCNQVATYLDRFLDEGARSRTDLDQISEHVSACPHCYTRLSHFFRTMELPESSYLRETLDELALALYNLGKAIIRDRPDLEPEPTTENVYITEPVEGSEGDNVRAGVEMIEDAEDYAGSSRVGGMDLDDLRGLLEDAETSRGMKIDLALQVFDPITRMDCRYRSEALNFIGVLNYQKEDLDRAEAAFLEVLASRDGARNVRALTHCNLSYVFKHRGDLERAVRSAERAVTLAELDGKDPYFGRFAAMYHRLLRSSAEDLDAGRGHLEAILAEDGGAERLRRDLHLATNAPVLEAFLRSPLAERFPAQA